jgi:predicted RNA-binding protein associated with RNAse of E/G family
VGEEIVIHYLRPPDRLTPYRQRLVFQDAGVIVTLAQDLIFDPPLCIEDEVVLETGSDAVWFTFPGVAHDIGRFHRRDGTFTGLYANILTPCIFESPQLWRTTDLFLDLWLPASETSHLEEHGTPLRPPRLLDEEEWAEALEQGALSPREAHRARGEAERILEAVSRGSWPPSEVWSWTRERAAAVLQEAGGR